MTNYPLERHGRVQIRERSFTGFTALLSPTAALTWREVIGVPTDEQKLSNVELTRRLWGVTCKADT
ncbi:hypothetical protein [Cupriavidus sp. amp6]|uniref:hypothetical protein n=1 Tax=Cupriavidus sp. amp6 TaxID=388051 RepID=UPI0012EB7FA9|nr:hypothetical protein [Cupriavidus sp. amp6]